MSNHDTRIPLRYTVLDVFAESAFRGNPLLVFHDARGLTTAQMQALARETNLSETTFVLPDSPERELAEGVRVRIFTTEEELPFAGHPTLGTAAWLRQHHPHLRGAETVRLRLVAGTIEVRFRAEAETGPGSEAIFGTMRQPDPVFGAVHAPEQVAALLGLPVEAIGGFGETHSLPCQTVSTGLPFCVVPVRSVEALGRMQLEARAAALYLSGSDAKFFYCLAPDGEAGFRARMQFYGGEDPATGSAAGCAAAWLVQHGVVPGAQQTVIRQGVEMGRPAHLTVEASRDGDRVTRVFVAGRTIPVASGQFYRVPEP